MNPAAQIATENKIQLQKKLVALLRANGRREAKRTWRDIQSDEELWAEVTRYDLGARERRSHLKRVAFPKCNADDVKAALASGANLNKLYALACGRASIARDADGSYLRGRRGLKIVLLARSESRQELRADSHPRGPGGPRATSPQRCYTKAQYPSPREFGTVPGKAVPGLPSSLRPLSSACPVK